MLYMEYVVKDNHVPIILGISNKFYKINDPLGLGLTITRPGYGWSILPLNEIVSNYVTGKLSKQLPITHEAEFLNDGVQIEGLQQVYNHDIIKVGTTLYTLNDYMRVIMDKERYRTMIPLKYLTIKN